MTNLLILLAILAAISVVVVPWYVARLASDADKYCVWQERFFQKFDLLMQDENTPAEFLEMAVLFGDHLRDRRVPRLFLWAMVSGQARARKRDGDLKRSDFSPEIPERTVMEFCLMGVAWFHAISYTSVITGRLMRNLMFPLFRRVADEEEKPDLKKMETGDARPFMELFISLLKNGWGSPPAATI